MFVDEMRAAIERAPRVRLAELSGALWKAYGAGAIGEAEAQQLAELIEARKVVPAASTPAPRRGGSRPRTPASLDRRRRWAASGWLPPTLACHFTLGELAALSTIAAEVARRGDCRMPLGQIAALAGVGKTTVRNAVRRAQGLGLLISEEWRLSAWRSAPNCIRLVSKEWTSWLTLSARRGGGSKTADATKYPYIQEPLRQVRRKSEKRGRDARRPPEMRKMQI